MKIQLKKPITEEIKISPRCETNILVLQGEELEEFLSFCLTKFTEGILDPDIAGRSPDRFVENLQKGAFGDFGERYIITAKHDQCTAGILIGMPEEEQKLHIYSLHVSPEYRKNGVGSALLCRCINDMYLNNIKEIILDVHTENKPAYELYKKFGFEVV